MMKSRKWTGYAFWIFLSLGTGLLSGFLIRNTTEIYSTQVIKPFLAPPAILFPIVWTLLYILMGISAGMIYLEEPSRERGKALNLFVIQLVLNFFWSPVFFNAQQFGYALLILAFLWIVVLRMIHSFKIINLSAGNLQIPYLLWLTFAIYLNYAVWVLN